MPETDLLAAYMEKPPEAIGGFPEKVSRRLNSAARGDLGWISFGVCRWSHCSKSQQRKQKEKADFAKREGVESRCGCGGMQFLLHAHMVKCKCVKS